VKKTMGDEIKVDTEQVLQISADIQRKNIERNQKLMEACTEILGLGNDGWKGSGAEAFFSGFRSFSSDYFPRHYENIHVYTENLKKIASEDNETSAGTHKQNNY
jgi:uncharacterized protein YukE